MTVEELTKAVDDTKRQTHDALQAVYDALNKGQRSKLIKDENIKALFERYDVAT